MRGVSRISIGLGAGLILLVLLPGCRQGSFLGTRYNNFRAYYNTFYNARKAFEAGEEALERSERVIDRSRFVSIFPATQSGAASGGSEFEQAIEKSADLLRERPDSKWADDALLLIGKAYFYQNNFVGAEGKFRETIEAADERDQPELADEARFWLGRTLSASERYEEATAILEEGLARPDIRSRWSSKMQLALGELYVEQRQWPEAAEALRLGIPETGEKDLSGRAQFLLGQVLEANGQFEEAATAYGNVAHHRPIYELSYAAKLSHALVLGIDASQTEEALDLIGRMRRDDKNFQNRAEVDLAFARLLGAADQASEAQRRFDLLLYDEEYRANNVRGEVYYRYAEFFRDEANDYVRAAAYFDTAATNVRAEPGREELVTRAALRDVRRSAEIYRSYASIASDLEEADSLLFLGGLNDDGFRAAIAEIEQNRLIQWEEEQRLLAQRRSEQGFGNAPTVRTGDIPADEGLRPGSGELPGGVESGFLNYRDPARSQDALLAFERIWGDRPLAPNWRRIQALRSAVVEGSGPEAGGDQQQANQATSSGPPPLDISNVPRTPEAQERLRRERAELRYELGNVFFLSLSKPDSAAHWYGLVNSEDSDQPVVTRARYALAEVRKAQGRDVEAEALYLQVIEDEPLSAQAAQARERLGLPPLEEAMTIDEHALAEAAYERAYIRWQNGAYREALSQMLALGAAESDEQVSPRALLVSGLIFTEWANEEGFDLEPGIPGDLVPDVLLDEADGSAEVRATTQQVEEIEALEEPDEEVLTAPDINQEEQGDLRLPDQPQDLQIEAPPQVTPSLEQAAVSSETELREVAVLAGGSAVADPQFENLPIDSQVVLQDTTGLVIEDTLAVQLPDSLVQPAAFLSLAELYSIIETRYPETEFATQAASRKADLLAVLTPPPAVQPVETDSVSVAQDLMLPLGQEVIDAAPEGTFGLQGDVPLNGEIGGFGWKVASVPSPLAAQAMLRNFAERGLRAGVFRVEQDRRVLFAMILGQFTSVEEAEAARMDLPETGVGRELEVIPIHGLEFLSADDLDRLRPD